MATQRFPHRKYLRQLRDMRAELIDWSADYMRVGRLTSELGLARRIEERAQVLDDVQAKLLDAFLILEELPRLT